ncbi:porin family protein [Chitinophaga sp. S165]|uniref:porin family protein n=1 Tax=Chitinophaga sp. S165 TaxID=2135462 RepID=UPI000D7169D6|nr:porin family protein [Chitinophaga sp. S165]PWV49554.1 outer membrane protein with beta-barrel domain [Chitinophaga sp. S165]
MKKLFLAIAVLSVTAVSTANAQTKFLRFGLKGGANLGKLDGQGYKDGFKLGYHLGGFAQVNLTKVFGVQGELIFSSNSVKTTDDFSQVYNPDNLNDPANNDKKIKLNYLSIPILANISLGSPRVKLQVGPQFSALVSNKNVFKGADDAFNGGDVSGVAGLWIQLPIINISARYIVGFTDVKGISTVNTDNWKNQSIQLGVGVTL